MGAREGRVGGWVAGWLGGWVGGDLMLPALNVFLKCKV